MGPVSEGSGGDLPARRTAYADLVAALLDLRDPASTSEFDQALAGAVSQGLMPDSVARQLKWLQRQSLRAVVEHAAHVLPATLVALEGEHPSAQQPEAGQPETPPAATQAETPPTEPPAVDLTARRLLVAGLRPIEDPPFP